ncbi:hypothetical protein Taro_052579 [Colocasia esculenta]|uniref:BURP domain-containing protein n=1 Tax=Colocasia esculenta TaxID=4460 RepID=A0A843XK37_COLES|nr:hypothetical protein [Colocasia esculenta]
MVDFVTFNFGTHHVWVLSTDVPTRVVIKQEYMVASSPKLIAKNNITCHPVAYPYAVFYCHVTSEMRAYMAPKLNYYPLPLLHIRRSLLLVDAAFRSLLGGRRTVVHKEGYYYSVVRGMQSGKWKRMKRKEKIRDRQVREGTEWRCTAKGANGGVDHVEYLLERGRLRGGGGLLLLRARPTVVEGVSFVDYPEKETNKKEGRGLDK